MVQVALLMLFICTLPPLAAAAGGQVQQVLGEISIKS
jgi:hypothetical protein